MPAFALPVALVRMLAGFIGTVAKTAGIKAPITRETVDKYTEDIAVDGSLFQKETGFAPRYDLKTGWEETIREMRNEKII